MSWTLFWQVFILVNLVAFWIAILFAQNHK